MYVQNHQPLSGNCVSWVQHMALKTLLEQSPVARLALDAVPGPKTYEFAQMMGMLAFMVSASVPLHDGCVHIPNHVTVTDEVRGSCCGRAAICAAAYACACREASADK